MALTAAAFRSDKRCGKSGIPDNAKCSKRTSAKSTQGPELKERAFAVAGVVQGARAARSYVTGNKGRAVKQLLSAGKNAAEYAQERGERTGNKRLLAFATGKNLVESAQAASSARKAFKTGNWKSAAFNISEAANTGLEAYTFNRQRQGRTLSNWEEQNRNFGDLIQAQKWVSAVTGSRAGKSGMRINPRTFSRSLRRQNKLNNARLMTEKMRRKYEPGYRNSKKPFWADGFESELTAGLFHMDKKCGASGIPDNAKCTKGVGRTIAQQKKRESVPKDKEYKQLRALEKEMDKEKAKNAPPKTTRQLTRTKGQLAPEDVARLSKSQIRWREKNYTGKPSDEEFARRLLTPGTRTRQVAQGYLSAPNGDWRSKALKEGIQKGRKNPAAKGSTEAAMFELRKRELLNRRVKFAKNVATAGLVVGVGANAGRKEAERQRATIAEAQRITGSSNWRRYNRSLLDSITAIDFRDDACWKGYVQKGVKRKGNRTVPNCVPVGKAKAELKRKTGQDGEDKMTKAKRKVWAEGF